MLSKTAESLIAWGQDDRLVKLPSVGTGTKPSPLEGGWVTGKSDAIITCRSHVDAIPQWGAALAPGSLLLAYSDPGEDRPGRSSP